MTSKRLFKYNFGRVLICLSLLFAAKLPNVRVGGRLQPDHRRQVFNACFRVLIYLLTGVLFALPVLGDSWPVDYSSPEILHELQSFRQMGSVLYIAAHPDDENTELLAYLSRGRDYRTAYLSLTRGDGGQNVLGPDFGEKLGVARTQELLAARRMDGARQFFSRAVDFGFSKDYRETLRIWDRQGVLSDMVRVIREFRPDVLVTRFSPIPGGTHGHHTASTILALEAFKLAGDPKAFPEQELAPWQPKRILWNVSGFQRQDIVGTNQVRIDAGGVDPVSGESFAEIAGRVAQCTRPRALAISELPVAMVGRELNHSSCWRRARDQRYFGRRGHHLEPRAGWRGNRKTGR